MPDDNFKVSPMARWTEGFLLGDADISCNIPVSNPTLPGSRSFLPSEMSSVSVGRIYNFSLLKKKSNNNYIGLLKLLCEIFKHNNNKNNNTVKMFEILPINNVTSKPWRFCLDGLERKRRYGRTHTVTMSRRYTHRRACCESNAVLWLWNMSQRPERTL